MGSEPLSNIANFEPLKLWLSGQGIKTLWDLSVQNNKENTWKGWKTLDPPEPLLQQWTSLTSQLNGRVSISSRSKDIRGWGKGIGHYTVAQGYQALQASPKSHPNPTLWKGIWKVKSIPKIDMFIWTLAHQIILTNENLKKRRIIGPSSCTLCYQQVETSNHIFLYCKYAKEVWQEVLGPWQ